MKYFYDLHIHSALSACADDDMTPNNIVNMCRLKGLDIIAIADHNCYFNADAASKICGDNLPIIIPAMELTTSEDIHLLCLFDSFEKCRELFLQIEKKMLKIKNKRQIFGGQIIYDKDDNIIGEYENLLNVSSGISIEGAIYTINNMGGVAIPAHIDRQSNSLIGVLGHFDYSLGVRWVESKSEVVKNLPYITNSDAHCLYQINERQNFLELDILSVKGTIEYFKK